MGKKSRKRRDSDASSKGLSAQGRSDCKDTENTDCILDQQKYKNAPKGAIRLVKQPTINLHFDVDAEIENKDKKWLKVGCLNCYLYPCVDNARLKNYKGKTKDYLKDYEVQTYKIPSRGSTKPKILFITDSPGYYDDEEGICLVGEAGKILSEAIDDAMIPVDDCRFTQVTRCRGLEGKTPALGDAIPCSAFLAHEIEKYKPDMLVPMGALALKILMNDKDAKINAQAGVLDTVTLTVGTFNVFPLWSPGVVSRDFGFYEDFVFYMCRLRQAVYSEIDTDEEFKIHVSKDKKTYLKAKKLVKEILVKSRKLVYDIETVSLDTEKASGLNPYVKCTKIVSIAFEYTHSRSLVLFTYHPDVSDGVLRKNKSLAKKLLLSNIPKIAHNAKFDDVYIKSKWGIESVNLVEDTLLSHYALVTERTGTHGLKMLAIRYAQLGDYSKDMRDEDAFESDNLFSIDIDKVGRYNAIDTIATGRISRSFKSMVKIKKSPAQSVAKHLLPKASKALTDLEFSGLYIDIDIATKVTQVFARNLQMVLDKIEADTNVRLFIDTMDDLRARGIIGKSVKEFKIGSGQQVAVILFHEDFYGFVAEEFTPTGRAKTDGDVLNNLATAHDCDLLKLLLEYRRYKTTLSTYLKPFVKNAKRYKGFLHGNFNLNVTATGRLCVAKGTEVYTVGDTSKGTKRVPIEEIKVGDLVYTYDEDRLLTIKPVVWVGKTGHKNVMRLHWRSTGNKRHVGYVDLTLEHRVRKSDGTYCPAMKLSEGDSVLSMLRDGDFRIIKELQEKVGNISFKYNITKTEFLYTQVDVYDLEVEDTHNFIANGVCVHNSSANPNLQNIPNKSSGHVKRLFVSRYTDGLLVSIDYSQVELRVLASLSGDEKMLAAYREGRDLHKLTTLLIYDITEDEYDSYPEGKRKMMRIVAKRINFGVVYGIQAEGIIRLLKKENIYITEDEANEHIKKFFDNYSGVEAWIRKTENHMLDTGISVSAFGRVRRFPEVLYQQSAIQSYKYWTQNAQDFFAFSSSTKQAKRQAVNHVIQSTASDLTLCSLIVMNNWIKENYPNEASIFNIIHDALDFDVKREVALEVINKSMDVMSNLPNYAAEIFGESSKMDWDFFNRLPIDVSVDVGVNWRDSLEIENLAEFDSDMLNEYLKKSKALEIENDRQLITQL